MSGSSTYFTNKPEWILFGVIMDDKHVVFGSTELSQIELEVVYEDGYRYKWELFEYAEPDRLHYVRLGARMYSFAFAVGDTYGEAIQNLFNSWDPDKKRPGLPQTGLPPGGDRG